MRKIVKITGIFFCTALVFLVSVIAYFIQSRKPGQKAQVALQSSDLVDVSFDNWLVFYPLETQATTGLILYPGTFVDPGAYAELAHAIAKEGYLVVLVPVPLGIASLTPDRAAQVQPAFPEIDTWVIGGHSQGAATATRYVFRNPDVADGLLLWVGKPLGDDDLSDRDIPVMSLYGTLDRRRPPEIIAEIKLRYPPHTEYIAIEGGNHIYFGDYSPEDSEAATISHNEQTEIIVENSVVFLANITTDN